MLDREHQIRGTETRIWGRHRMPEIGGPSRVVEDEPRDISVVWEQLVTPVPVQPVVESEPESDPEMDPTEGSESDSERGFITVEGREFEPPTDDDEEHAEELDATPESEIIEELMDRNTELEDKVAELEEKVQQYDGSVDQMGSLVHLLVSRNTDVRSQLSEAEQKLAEAEQTLAESEQHRQQLMMEKQAMEAYWQEEIESRDEMKAERDAANDQVKMLEDEVRQKKVKIDRVAYAYRSSYGRLQSRVFHFPAEENQTRHTISRSQVMAFWDQEYEDAVYRGMHRY